MPGCRRGRPLHPPPPPPSHRAPLCTTRACTVQQVIGALRSGTDHAGAAGLLALLAGVAITGAAWATPGAVVKRDVRTVALRAGRVTTVEVPYPDALEFAGARYSGSVKLLPAATDATGRRPDLQLVSVLSRGPAEGGSLFRVRIRNANPPGTLPARAVLMAITRVPAGS